MKVVEGILSRTSARKLAEPGPDAEALNIILSCGVAAPDHGRLEP